MKPTTQTSTTPPPVSPPECLHLEGYWINRANGNFRCYECGHQFFTRDIPRQPGRKIETWKA